MEGNSALSWRKSSRSGNNGGQCIEVAVRPVDEEIMVRDSKNPESMRLAFPPESWNLFISELKASLLFG
jgi:hypothetical protein